MDPFTWEIGKFPSDILDFESTDGSCDAYGRINANPGYPHKRLSTVLMNLGNSISQNLTEYSSSADDMCTDNSSSAYRSGHHVWSLPEAPSSITLTFQDGTPQKTWSGPLVRVLEQDYTWNVCIHYYLKQNKGLVAMIEFGMVDGVCQETPAGTLMAVGAYQ